MGVAGDMLMAALIELLPHPNSFITKLNYLGLPDVKISKETLIKNGISGTHITVKVGGEEESKDAPHSHPHPHPHSHGEENSNHNHSAIEKIYEIISNLPVSDKVKSDAKAVYSLIADAESTSHNVPVSMIHFHEVGAMDAIADIIGVCMAIEELNPDKIIASPIHVGYGQVKCSHGILPIPAPATAEILKGIPTYSGRIEGELCTPTGAALIKHFASEFSQMPIMSVNKIGYGAGKKDFAAANIIRAFVGEKYIEKSSIMDEIVELSCNLDDMTGEEFGFATEQLLNAGALDVFPIPIQMKKNRPGQMLNCICKACDADKIAQLILKHTTTLGVRKHSFERYTLNREICKLNTSYGVVRSKISSGYGIEKQKFEYEDIAKIARDNDLSYEEAITIISREVSK